MRPNSASELPKVNVPDPVFTMPKLPVPTPSLVALVTWMLPLPPTVRVRLLVPGLPVNVGRMRVAAALLMTEESLVVV